MASFILMIDGKKSLAISREFPLSAMYAGSPPIRFPDERAWARGVEVLGSPEFEQFEALRRTVIAKNRL